MWWKRTRLGDTEAEVGSDATRRVTENHYPSDDNLRSLYPVDDEEVKPRNSIPSRRR